MRLCLFKQRMSLILCIIISHMLGALPAVARDGGNSGGGGNGFEVPHLLPNELESAYKQKKVILQVFLNRLQNKLLNMPYRDEQTQLLATKMFSEDLLSTKYQDKLAQIKIDFQDKDSCYDKFNNPKVGSIYPKNKDKDICISTVEISKMYNKRESPVQMFGLILHETYHLLRKASDCGDDIHEEDDAIWVQGNFIADYDVISISLLNLQQEFDLKIKPWDFEVLKSKENFIRIKELRQICWTIVKDLYKKINKANTDPFPSVLFSELNSLNLIPISKIKYYQSKMMPLLSEMGNDDYLGTCDGSGTTVFNYGKQYSPIVKSLMEEIEFYTGLK